MLTSPGWRIDTRRALSLASYGGGAIGGGALIASLLWLSGGLFEPLSRPTKLWILVAAALIGVARDARIVRFPLPQNRRLVPQTVFGRGRIRGPLQFGFEMGTGLRTYISSTAPYVLALAVPLLARSIGAALLAGAGFGLGRSVLPWSRQASKDGSVWDLKAAQRMTWIPWATALYQLPTWVFLTRLSA